MRISKSMLLGAVLTAGLIAPTAALAEGDAKKGAKVFKKCVACHTATEEKNKVGPHLVGIVDRAVASVEGYEYSPAMTAFVAVKPVWDAEVLEAYLRAPKVLVEGTKMAFAGLKKDDDVANIIAYLKDPASAKTK